MNAMFQENIGLKRYFQVQRFAFARIGMDPTSDERIITNPIMTFLPLVAMATLCLAILHYTVVHITDVNLVTDALSPFCQGFMAVFKVIIFLWKRKQMVRLIKRIWEWNLHAKDEERNIIVAANKTDILFCSLYHVAVTTTGTMALVAPFIIATVLYITNGQFKLEPAVKASQFVDHTKPFNYFLIHTWDTFAVYNVAYGSVSIDTLFSWFMRNILAQFEILHLRLRRAATQNKGAASTQHIIDCIKYHRQTIEIAEELNNVFEQIIFVKFFISCVQICCLAYQFSAGGEAADMAFQGLFLTTVAVQLMLYCYNGQKLSDESELIATKIYDTFHWELMSVRDKKLLLLPMIRSRKPCTLSGVFFVVDLTLYLWVFRTAASYITMLWTLDEDA